MKPNSRISGAPPLLPGSEPMENLGVPAASPVPKRPRAAPLWLLSVSFLLLLVEVPACGAPTRPEPRAPSPTAVIRVLDQSLLASMRAGPGAGFAGRYHILEPVIRRTIAWKAMLRLLTGQDWTRISAAQRHELRHLFIHYTIANYAHEFNGYQGQSFHITKHRHYPAYDLVIARFNERDHRHHTFVYLLQKAHSAWRVVNIFVDGVSNLSLLKSQFQFVVKKSGVEGLFDYLTRSIRRFETPTGHHRNHAP